MKNLSKYLTSFLYAAILSGLGYGVWTNFLEPFLLWLFNNLFQFWDSVQSSFIDSIYDRAMKEEVNIWYANTTLYLRFIFIFLFFFFVRNINANIIKIISKSSNEKINRLLNRIILINYFLLIIITFILMSHIFSVSQAKTISSYVYRGIEIVRPNMTETEYIKLKSKIIQGNSKTAFNYISESLKSYSDQDHVLPDEPKL